MAEELHNTHLLLDELRVELHGFDEGDGLAATAPARPLDVTPFVRSLRWRHSTTAPYETINMVLALPPAALLRELPGVTIREGQTRDLRLPAPGSWCVIRSRNVRTDGLANHGAGWPALFWGRVSRISFAEDYTARPEGVESVPQTLLTRVSCESWATALTRSQILLTAGQTDVPEGFAYTLSAWSAILEPLLSSASEGNGGAGEVMRKVFELVAKMELPESLGAGARKTLAEAVAVIFDRATAAESAPMRLGQTARVPGLMMPAANLWTSSSVWGFLASTFAGGAQQIELFPSLELPTTQAPTQGRPWRREDELADEAAPANGLPPKQTSVGAALGAQPVLVYRLAPHLYRAVDALLLQEFGLSGQPLAQRLAAEFGAQVTTFGQDPVSLDAPARWYVGRQDDLVRYEFTQDDGDRVNAVGFRTPVQPSAVLSMYGPLGLPAVLGDDVRRHGLRLAEVAHPYWILPPGGPPAPEDEGTVGAIHTAQAEIAYGRLACNDQYFFGRASLLVAYAPQIQAGHFFRVPVTRGGEEWGVMGYIEAAEHSVELSPKGAPIRRTSLTLGRALFGPLGQWVQPVVAVSSRGAP